MITYKSKTNKNYEGYIIYQLTNPSGEIYIGATTNLYNRIDCYEKFPSRYKNQTNLYNSIEKWGFNKHELQILVIYNGSFEVREMIRSEMAYILNIWRHTPHLCLNGVIKGVDHKLKIKK